MQISEPVAVEPFLHAGDALVVDIDQADQMGDLVAGRIDALVLAQEADAGNAEAVNLLLLLRRDFALQPDEAFLRRQAVAHLAGVEIGQGRGQKLDRLVLVDDAPGLAEQARRLDVGGKHRAVAVDDIGPRGRNPVLACGPARARTVRADRKHHEAAADHGIDHHEGEDDKPDARACFRGAIDVASVQQAADEPLPPRFHRLDLRRRGMGHCLSSGRGTEPVTVTEPESAAVAMALIIAPIGSGSPGLTRLGGRSGRLFKLSYCVAVSGFSGRWRSARPCSRSGASSLAHSDRNAAIASRCSRISARSRSTRSVRAVESILIW